MPEILKRLHFLENLLLRISRQEAPASTRMEAAVITGGEISIHNHFVAVDAGVLTDIFAMNDGFMLTLTMGSGTVTVNEGGNIQLNAGVACVLDAVNDTLTLIYRLDVTRWLEISRSSS